MFCKYAVNCIHSHHIFRCCYSVMDTKILEDLENINVKENKHESWSRPRTASRKPFTFVTKSSIQDFAVVVDTSLFRMGYSLVTEVEKEAPNRMNTLYKESFSQPFSENSTMSSNRFFPISYVDPSRWLLPFGAASVKYLALLLTLSWRRPLSYRNQSVDLQSLRHERVNNSKQVNVSGTNSMTNFTYL